MSAKDDSADHALEDVSIDEKRYRLERERFKHEALQNSLDMDLRREELRVRESEGKKTDPLVLAIVAGLIAAFSSVFVAYQNNQNQIDADRRKHQMDVDTESDKAEASRILEAVKLGDPDRSACTLKFLMNGGLIKTESLRSFIDAYLANRRGGSGVGDGRVQPSSTPGALPGAPKEDTEIVPRCQIVPKHDAILSQNTTEGDAPLQTFVYKTGWMDGGHNQNEACERGIQENQPKFPGKTLSRLSSDEESRRVGLFGHVEYNYYCTIAVNKSK